MDTDKYKDLKKKKEELKEEGRRLMDRWREKQEEIKPLLKFRDTQKLTISTAKAAISKTKSKEKKKECEDIISECKRKIRECERILSPKEQEMERINRQRGKIDEKIMKAELEIKKCLG